MRVVIVGAGVVGLACAYELVSAGHDVTVLDAGAPGEGASAANAGKVAVAETGPVAAPGAVLQALKWMLHPASPVYIRPTLSPAMLRFLISMSRHCNESQFRYGLELNLGLARGANEILDAWTDDGVRCETHDKGVLLAFEDAGHFRARLSYHDLFDAAGAHGIPLGPRGLRDLEPALSTRIRHGLYYPQDRQVEPMSLNRSLAERVTQLGGRVCTGQRATGFSVGTRGVQAVLGHNGADYDSDAVVLAAGAATGALATMLGVRLPIQPGKGYSVDYQPSPVALRTSLTLEDAHVAVTPLNGLVRLAGTMEFSGWDTRVNHRRVQAIVASAEQSFSEWDPQPGSCGTPWAGLRPMTPDGLPIIGRLGPRNAYVATGHGMLGLTQAPATARLVRDLVSGVAAEDPALSPNRFRATRRIAVRRPRSASPTGDFAREKRGQTWAQPQ